MKNFEVIGLTLDETDRKIVLLLQSGMEITERPYKAVADECAITEAEVCERLKKMAAAGFVRKNAIATNHYLLGFNYNAMTVWELDSSLLESAGVAFRKLGFVSHCYERPKRPPQWTYNLFAMVHATSAEEIDQKVEQMKNSIGGKFIRMDLIFSTAILKKTGIRLKDKQNV